MHTMKALVTIFFLLSNFTRVSQAGMHDMVNKQKSTPTNGTQH